MFKVVLFVCLELCNDSPDIADSDKMNNKLSFGWSIVKGVSLFKFDFKV